MNRKERRRREKLNPFSHAFTVDADGGGVTMTLGPKQEERLRRRAKRLGLSLDEYLEKTMNEAAAPFRAENARAKGLPPPTTPMRLTSSRLHVPTTDDGAITAEALAVAVEVHSLLRDDDA
jgi:hypothetical protein